MTESKDKMQEDYSGRVETTIPEQIQLAKSGKLNEAIENLLALEKQTRQAEDHPSTSKLAIAIVKLCYEAKDYKLLNQNLVLLSKRRGQLRSVVQDFVQEGMKYLDDPLEKSVKMELLETLRNITEGKIFVEIERARLTRRLAAIREEEGNVGEAAEILQEIQVETFGQMDKIEKAEFVLEQIRLCIAKKDIIKANILSKKISSKSLADEEMQDVKLKYYKLMIQIYSHEEKLLDICRAFHAMYHTPKVQTAEAEWTNYLQNMVLWVVLSPYDNEQSDLANRISGDRNLEKIPAYKKLLQSFLTRELMRWPLVEEVYGPLVEAAQVPEGQRVALREVLCQRVVEHNLRVVATYYSRIRLRRLAQLLDLEVSAAEEALARQVERGVMWAKLDRPAGLIVFHPRVDPNAALSNWAQSLHSLLGHLETACHSVHRDMMVHAK